MKLKENVYSFFGLLPEAYAPFDPIVDDVTNNTVLIFPISFCMASGSEI
nr:photosystem II protein K [Euglena agilis]WCH63306.1 photosystem II protein K [Euglena agilis]